MIRRCIIAIACGVFLAAFSVSTDAQAGERAFGRVWGNVYSPYDWNRFYHYPYVYYPQNFRGNEYYRSYENLYHRYPPEMRVPVYNNMWHNFYPNARRYHFGNHFRLDVF